MKLDNPFSFFTWLTKIDKKIFDNTTVGVLRDMHSPRRLIACPNSQQLTI
jgi:hypothetical protein